MRPSSSPPAGLGDTPLHSLMHLFSIQFSLWSWCLARTQGCFWSLDQTSSRSTHLSYLPFLAYFLSIYAIISKCKRIPELPHKKRHWAVVVLRPASIFTFASAASSHISTSLLVSHAGTVLRYTQDTGMMGTTHGRIFWWLDKCVDNLDLFESRNDSLDLVFVPQMQREWGCKRENLCGAALHCFSLSSLYIGSGVK